MSQVIVIAFALLILIAPASGFASGSDETVLRYRGEYTYGHEVRSFCPAINSQCYWVGAGTSAHVHATLKKLATRPGAAPYTPVCVVIEGRIDRDSKRTGFAEDYDGLISIGRVYDRCDETDIVTQGDLQHHRWLLESINDNRLDPDTLHGMIPELDFGERMTVTGNTGCNRFNGRAMLREEFFVVERMTSTRRACPPPNMNLERTFQQVLGGESVISIGANRQLTLKSGQTVLRFRLFDWRQ
ncbi:MAG: META domain-containing protein [Betaproteobacteria bacterium]|nr:MAG: META domain-containing protein [Betaproteobacteria bacterium]